MYRMYLHIIIDSNTLECNWQEILSPFCKLSVHFIDNFIYCAEGLRFPIISFVKSWAYSLWHWDSIQKLITGSYILKCFPLAVSVFVMWKQDTQSSLLNYAQDESHGSPAQSVKRIFFQCMFCKKKCIQTHGYLWVSHFISIHDSFCIGTMLYLSLWLCNILKWNNVRTLQMCALCLELFLCCHENLGCFIYFLLLL